MKTAFVSGADRGLGLSLCRKLLERGWTVLAGQYIPAWTELENLKKGSNDKLHVIPLDISSDQSVRLTAAKAAEIIGSLDLLINNAGVTGSVADVCVDRNFDLMLKTIDINTIGPLRLSLALLPLFQKSELKCMSFISSEAGSIGACERIGETGYCMSKAALNMGVKTLFNALHPKGLIFKLYHPGWMRTYMMGEKDPTADLDPDYAAELAISYFLSEENKDTLVLRGFDGKVWPW